MPRSHVVVQHLTVRKKRFEPVWASLGPQAVELRLNSTAPCTWIRIGLVPGVGRFQGHARLFSLCSVLIVRAPESRTLHIEAASSLL